MLSHFLDHINDLEVITQCIGVLIKAADHNGLTPLNSAAVGLLKSAEQIKQG